jgi:hypothetical protein
MKDLPKGPWTFADYDGEAWWLDFVIRCADGERIAAVFDRDDSEEVARAIAGIPDREREIERLRRAVSLHEQMGEPTYLRYKTEVIILRARNAKLVEALQGVIDVADRKTEAFDKARAILAEAKDEPLTISSGCAAGADG